MMMRKTTFGFLTATVLSASMLASCAENGGMDSQVLGQGIGAVAGGVLGSQFGEGSGKTVAAVVGALAGAWVGNKVVQGMSTQDQGYYNTAATKAAEAPVGQQITWYNPNSGTQGTIVPVRDGRTPDGQVCREYQQTITVGGKTQKAYGTACRQSDGSWKIVN